MRSGIVFGLLIAFLVGGSAPGLAKSSINEILRDTTDEIAATVEALQAKLSKTDRSEAAIARFIDKAASEIGDDAHSAISDIAQVVSGDESQRAVGDAAISAIRAAEAAAGDELRGLAAVAPPRSTAPITTTTTTAAPVFVAPPVVTPTTAATAVVVPAQPRLDEASASELPLTRLPDRIDVSEVALLGVEDRLDLFGVALPSQISNALAGPVALGTILLEAIRSTSMMVALGAMLCSVLTAIVLWKRSVDAGGTG